MLAQMELSTEDLEILERAFPATEINGVKIPQTYQQAINDPTYSKQWKLAITEEIISLIENGTWKQVVPPAGANLVSTKWVFTIKTKADGTIEGSRPDSLQGASVKYTVRTIVTPSPQLFVWTRFDSFLQWSLRKTLSARNSTSRMPSLSST